ncbi:MAG: methyltransferase regulatory domain-containing protein [Pirellulales bacterium]
MAYVSYNTYPGWHFRGMIRDVMAYHAKFFDSPEQQLGEARSLVNFLSKSVPVEDNPYGMLLSRELEQLKDKHSYYLYHEFLEEFNEPIYFHQLAERLDQHGLQYLGEADFSSMSASNFPPQVEKMLRTVSNDTIRMEQYMDFVRNRMFRQTLVCHRSVELQRDVPWQNALKLFVSSNSRPAESVDLHSTQPITYSRPGSTMTTREPLVKAAMAVLSEHWPRSVMMSELVTLARRKLNSNPQLLSPEQVRQEQQIIAQPLIRCYATTHVDLSYLPTTFATTIAEYPKATAFARHQAQQSNRLTNLNHQSVGLTDLQRHLIGKMDGQHDRTQLLEYLVEQVVQGNLIAHDAGIEVRDEARIREMLSGILEQNLQQILRKSLLVPGL